MVVKRLTQTENWKLHLEKSTLKTELELDPGHFSSWTRL